MRQSSQQGPGQGYHLGIDLGSTCTAAAVCRAAGRPEPVALGPSDSAITTAAFLTDEGELLIGAAAQRRSAAEPQRVARGFTRRIGDDTPLVLGDHTLTAAELAARFVRAVVELVAVHEGGAPDTVALTHPASWGAHRRDTLTRALAATGLTDVLLVSEPAAAALGHAGAAGLAAGTVVAVYDLGGDSFEAAVLDGDADGNPQLRGRPVGLDLGGIDFDEHVLDQVRYALGDAWDTLDTTDPAVLAAVAALRRDCATAKEALSADVDAVIPVLLPGTHTRVRIGRADFEDRIRRDVEGTVEALQRALAAAATDPAVPQTVLLVGGSSRIPLVPQLVSAGLGRPITVDTDPRTTVARGAAFAAQRRAHPAAAEIVTQPTGAPQRPAVVQLRTAAPPLPLPAAARPALRVRVALVAALATVGIALAAAATAYTVDPALLSGESPVALVGPAASDSAANTTGAGARAAENASTEQKAEEPADEPAPDAATPARSGPAPARHIARTPRPAAVPTTAAAPPAAPMTGAPVPIVPPTSAAPPAPGKGTAGPGDAGTDPPPAENGGGVPTGTPPAGHGNGQGAGSGDGAGSGANSGNSNGSDGPSTGGGDKSAPGPAPIDPPAPFSPLGR